VRSRLIIALLSIAIIALLVVYYFLGMGYREQRQGHEVLSAHIAEATQALAQTPRPPQDLEQRLAAARASLAAEQSAFPSQLNSTQVINAILKLADDCQVKAIPIATQPWSVGNIGGGYHVFRLNISIRGSFSQLASFVSELENGEFETLVIENLSVTRAAGQTKGEIIPVTARLNLAIYTQPPISE